MAAIAGTLPRVDLTFVGPESPDPPPQWRPIAAEPDPRARSAMALALWNKPFLDAVPRFAAALRAGLTDVRACLADGEPALLYLAADGNGRPLTWLGGDPAGFVEPPFWAAFPAPLQVFLREVHAGFTSGGRTAFGPMHPRHMLTLAELAGEPGGLPDWDEEQEIASTRLLLITSNDGMLHYCVSPDLDEGHVALVFQGDLDPLPYGAALDDLLMLRVER